MSGRDFFAVDSHRRSSVVAVVRHFPFSSKGGTFEKNQIFAVFQKLAIFLKSKIFSKMSGRDFFAVVTVVVGRRRRRSSPSFRHFPFSSKGGTFEKNQIFAVFQKLAIFLKSKIFSKMSGRDFFAVDGRRRRPSFPFFVQGRDLWKKSNFRCFSVVAVVGRRRRRSSPSSVISLFRPREGPLKKIRFSLFFKNSQFFWNPRFLAKWVDEIFSPSTVVVVVAVVRRRRQSSPSSVISLFRPREGPLKKIRFSLFFKNSQFFWNPRFLAKWVDEIFSPSVIVGRRRSSPSSVVAVVRHFPFSSKGGTFEKNQIFAVFQKLAIFLKSKIFSKMSGRDFFAVDGRRRRPSFPFFVQGRDLWKKSNFRCFSKTSRRVVGRRRRRSSPSSVISLFRPREGPLKKIRFSLFFKNSQFFWNPRFLAKWVDEIFSPSTVVAVVRHFPFSSKGGTFEKNQIFAVFQKLAIFLKSKIFSKMSGRDFFAVDGRRPSSVVAVVRHFPFSSKGGTFEKNQIFAVFQKLAIFLKSKIFSKMSGRDFFAVDGRRRRPSFPFFVQGRDLWKKSDFRCFSKTRNFSEIQDF